jgi:hypothetical protein
MFWRTLFISFLLNQQKNTEIIFRSSSRIEDYLPKKPVIVSSISHPFFGRPPINQSAINNTLSGHDQRHSPFSNKTHDAQVVMNITHFQLQMDLLRHLENNGTSKTDKIRAINDFNKVNGPSPMKMDVLGGGLFHDWFNIF